MNNKASYLEEQKVERKRREASRKSTSRNELAYEEHLSRLAKKHNRMFTSEFAGEESEFWGE